MPKRLVICCDGTWNSYDSASPTNVLELRNLIVPVAPDGFRQSVYYDTGIGTLGGWLRRAIDGATGRGLSENIRQAYRALIDNYETGDQIYLFGFSRGAFTVRSLAGLIRKCGILRRDEKDLVTEAYTFYRDRNPKTRPDKPGAIEFRNRHAVADVTHIRFIGVWDTVGSLGNPLMRHGLVNRSLQFHDVNLSSIVKTAFQALAIDEYRPQFQPAVWIQQPHSTDQVMEQAWFIGAHSDVGGGYPQRDLPNIALEWLARKAMAEGLAIDPGRLRGQLGTPFPSWMPMPHDSHRGFYRLFPPRPRDIDPSSKRGKAPRTNERLHFTVIERYSQDLGYRPPGLVDYVRRNPGVLEGEPSKNPLLQAS